MKLGFTGTQQGMTDAQKVSFAKLLDEIMPDEFHHGDCVGADSDAHDIVTKWDSWHVKTVGYPALVSPLKRANKLCDETKEAKDPLARNKDIVLASHVLVATPNEFEEVLRSGTWSTIRYARKQGKPIVIIYRDGSVVKERQ